MSLNLTSYLPKPFEMEADRWTITSPVPSARVGKLIAGFQALQAEQFRRANAGEPLLNTETIDGWPEDFEDVTDMVLGARQVQELKDDGCPPTFLFIATWGAIAYWANGGDEDAAELFVKQLMGANGEPESKPRPKGSKRSKTGNPTA